MSDTTEHPDEVVVSAEWLSERLDAFVADDPAFVLLDVSVDTTSYEETHIPGAIGLDWQRDLQDAETFDVLSPADFSAFVGGLGITADTTVVVYGDLFNWFAAYAYWLFSYYGHDDVRLLDGGRDYWLASQFPTTTEEPSFGARQYGAIDADESIRADRPAVVDALETGTELLDVRSPQEYRGELLAPPGWDEGVQRGGHVPGAENVPWSRAVADDGRFRPASELRAAFPVGADEETIVYCRIGERSALVWVVLHELLGREAVRHYYGSWVEWGNTVGAPVERGREAGSKDDASTG